MAEPRATARPMGNDTKPKTTQTKKSQGRGGRGGRAMGRGRGRGRGSSGGARVMMAWDADSEDKSDSDDEGAAVKQVESTDSDYERQEEEIDAVVDVAELDMFAGTMVVDADDVELKREKIADAKNKSQAKKGKKKVKQAPEAKETKPKASGDAIAKKQKKPKKERVSIVITEDAALEVVQLTGERGVTESGQTIAITVKEKKKKPKKKKNGVGEATEVVYQSMQTHEVAEMVEVETGASEATAKSKKKKNKKTLQELAIASGEKRSPLPTKTTTETKPGVETIKAPEAVVAGDGEAKSEKQKKKKKGKKNHEDGTVVNSEQPPVQPKKGASDAKKPTKEATGEGKKAKAKSSNTQNTVSKGHATSKLESAPAGTASDDKAKKKNRASAPEIPRDNFYEDYSDRATVMDAIARGDLYQGKIRVNPQYRLRAFLTVDGIPVDILIDGTKDRNRAMDGDLVAVQLLHEDQWKPLQNTTKDDSKLNSTLVVERNGPVPAAEVEQRKDALTALWRPTLDASRCFVSPSAMTTDTASKTPALSNALSIAQRSAELQRRPTAKVVFIIAAGNAQGFVGSLEPKTKLTDPNAPLSPQDDYAYFNAQDLRLPRRIRIPRLQLPDEFVTHPLTYADQMMCFCRITKWSARHESPMGEFVKTLGEYSGIESGISAILMKHGLLQHTLDFRHEILAALDEVYGAAGEKWTIPDDEVAKRRDFRSYQIFSIDPYNARDLDDALHIRALDADATVFEVGVHIADVTHFIDKGSFLDVEAQQRATSVYLANRVLPMLPRILCERLCSLQPQVDRLAFSVVWQMHRDGTLVEDCVPWFGKSIIRSCCKLDYGTAQRMLDGTVTKDALDEWEVERQPLPGDNADITPASVIQAVKYLWLVAKARRATRFDTGAVTLQDIKLTFTLDAMGNPTSFGTYTIKDSNRLVEEYMLLANYLVAQKLLQAQGPLAFIRRHPEPNQTALVTTLATLSGHTIDIDGSSPKTLTDSLDNVRTSRGDTVYSVVQNMITKPMKPAEYLVAGSAGVEEAWRHYALNIPYYTHFTSPIRRYADVVVHRLLQESLVDAETVTTRLEAVGDDLTQLMTELQSVAQNCNEKKMAAKQAEKESDQVFLCAYVKHHGAVDVTGSVVSTGQRSFIVYIAELGLEQRIEVKDLGSVRWSYQEKTSTLSLEFGGSAKKRNKNKNKNKKTESDAAASEKTEANGNADSADTTGAAVVATELVDLKFLTKLRLRMTTTDRMPLALKFEVVGPYRE